MKQAVDKRLPLYQQLRDELAAKITCQEWRPGDAIPSESALAAQFDMAIGTVRKAIDQLVADHVLERQQGRGTFVRRARFNSSLFRFFRFQSEAGERRIPVSRILRRELMPAPSAISSALRLAEGEPVIHLSRLRIIDDEPLLAEEIWLQHARFKAIAELDFAEFGDLLYPLYEEQCGQIVVSAEETLTVAAADLFAARLLKLQPSDPLIVIDRLALDLERHPIEFRRSRGPASRFRYHVEIR